MPDPYQKQPLRFSLKRPMHRPATVLRRRARRVLDSVLTCYSKKPKTVPDDAAAASTSPHAVVDGGFAAETLTPLCHDHGLDKDLVSLKISLLGDSEIGKTSFLVRFVLLVGV